MNIQRNGSQPSEQAPAEYFTGTVRLGAPFQGSEPARVSGATVTFEPGARTNWHTHPARADADCDCWPGLGSARGWPGRRNPAR